MNSRLRELLDHLGAVLTVEREAAIEDLHRRALSWEPVERLPLVLSYPAPPDRFAPYAHAEALADAEKMLFNELVSAWGTSICHRAEVGDDLPCTIRANFGCGIIASLFGARIEQVGDNPPWVRNFETRSAFLAALERDPPDFQQGWCPRVLAQYDFYRSVLADYPHLERVVKVVLPDLQGPLDTLELLRGSEVYLDFYTEPELVARALATLAHAQIALAKHLASRLSDGPPGWSHQHGFLLPGSILVREDSALMLSPSTYREHVAPYDERVLAGLGGGGVHSCGRIAHNAAEYLSLPSARCLDLGQPELNDLDAIYAVARERRRPLIRLGVSEADLLSGAVLRRFPTGVSLFHAARSLHDARRIMACYLEASKHKE